MSSIEACCPGFYAQWTNRNLRGIAVSYEPSTGFWFEGRAIDDGVRFEVETAYPVSILTRVVIRFCPWCGEELAKLVREA